MKNNLTLTILIFLTTFALPGCSLINQYLYPESATQETAISLNQITVNPPEPTITPTPIINVPPNYPESPEAEIQMGQGTIYIPFVLLSNEPPLTNQQYTPAYVINFIHPELGCSYLGIAGQVFNLQGEPISGKIVEISGKINGLSILFLSLTGTAPYIGPGGFELKIADTPIASQDSVFIKVYDVDGKSLSNSIPIQTYADCNRNLIIINFKVNPESLSHQEYIPVINKGK